jgi:hypothetical protein
MAPPLLHVLELMAQQLRVADGARPNEDERPDGGGCCPRSCLTDDQRVAVVSLDPHGVASKQPGR